MILLHDLVAEWKLGRVCCLWCYCLFFFVLSFFLHLTHFHPSHFCIHIQRFLQHVPLIPWQYYAILSTNNLKIVLSYVDLHHLIIYVFYSSITVEKKWERPSQATSLPSCYVAVIVCENDVCSMLLANCFTN